MTVRPDNALICYQRIKRLVGILLISYFGLSSMGQGTSVSNINLGSASTQIMMKKLDVRIFRIKPLSSDNFEEYEIYPVHFKDPDSGIFDSLLLSKMKISINNAPVSKKNKIEALQNLKVSGLLIQSDDGLLPYSSERLMTPYGFTFLLHDGLVTLSGLKAITKDWRGQLGGILEFSVNNNDTIIFSKLVKGKAIGEKERVELTIAGPGAKIAIARGSIIDVEGLYNKILLPDDQSSKHIDQKVINVTLNNSMIDITYPTMLSNVQLQYYWQIRKINEKSQSKLVLIKNELIYDPSKY